MPHVIRLRGPWRYVALAATQLLEDGSIESTPIEPQEGSCQPPCDWEDSLGRDFRGRVRYHRPFNRPTGLGAGDRVELVIDRVDALASVWLNDLLLGSLDGETTFRCDIVERLDSHNRLTIEVDLPAPHGDRKPPRGDRPDSAAGGLVGDIRLEIFDGESQPRI